MNGVPETEVVDRHPPGPASDDRVTVVWDARTGRALQRFGLEESVSGTVDAVVVDRRGCETTPAAPGELVVEGARVVVVPDRSDSSPPVEIRIDGRGDRNERVVRTLGRAVALDAALDDAFESARRGHGSRRAEDGRPHSRCSTDGGPEVPTDHTEPCLRTFPGDAITVLVELDTSIAVGGFAAAVEPLR